MEVRPERVGAGMRPYRIGVIVGTGPVRGRRRGPPGLDAVRGDVAVELVEFDSARTATSDRRTLPDEELATMRGLDAILPGWWATARPPATDATCCCGSTSSSTGT